MNCTGGRGGHLCLNAGKEPQVVLVVLVLMRSCSCVICLTSRAFCFRAVLLGVLKFTVPLGDKHMQIQLNFSCTDTWMTRLYE